MTPIIHTFTGKDINPFKMSLNDIDILDIAHGLACSNRFNGHTKRPISIAQHSVYCARLCGGQYELQALLHDASESYVGDIVKWIKHTPEMSAFRRIEDQIQELIFLKFGCPQFVKDQVEMADRIMVRFEGMKGFDNFVINHPNYPPLTQEEINQVEPWDWWNWQTSEIVFLSHFRMLTR